MCVCVRVCTVVSVLGWWGVEPAVAHWRKRTIECSIYACVNSTNQSTHPPDGRSTDCGCPCCSGCCCPRIVVTAGLFLVEIESMCMISTMSHPSHHLIPRTNPSIPFPQYKPPQYTPTYTHVHSTHARTHLLLLLAGSRNALAVDAAAAAATITVGMVRIFWALSLSVCVDGWGLVD